MLQFFGDSEVVAIKNADKIFQYEFNLAEPRFTKEESTDTRKLYNPKTITELSEITPSINWETFFTGLGIENIDRVIVMQPNYMVAVEKILTSSSIDDVKLYLRWTAIDRAAGMLSNDIDVANW